MRMRGLYTVGSIGSGKTSLLKGNLFQATHDGEGYGVIDVEETLSSYALDCLADAGVRAEDVVVIDPTNTSWSVPLNVLVPPPGVHPYTAIEHVLHSFRRAWVDGWGPRNEDALRNGLLLCQENGLTIAELPRLLFDKKFRDPLIRASKHELVRQYFNEHLEQVPKGRQAEWLESLRNKLSALLLNPYISPFFACEDSEDFRSIMDNGRRLVVNVPDRVLGDAGRLLAMLIVSKLYMAALQRPEGSKLWSLYADEFHAIASRSFLDLTVRTRKRGISVIVAHQNCSQPPFDRDAAFLETILNNMATQVFFTCGREDAERFAKHIFEATGTQLKRAPKHPLWGMYPGPNPKFYSTNEEWEFYYSQLSNQRPRECFIRQKPGGVWCATTYELPRVPAGAGDALRQASLEAHGISRKALLAARQTRLDRVVPKKKAKVVKPYDGEPA
jgi:hypothetical protein